MNELHDNGSLSLICSPVLIFPNYCLHWAKINGQDGPIPFCCDFRVCEDDDRCINIISPLKAPYWLHWSETLQSMDTSRMLCVLPYSQLIPPFLSSLYLSNMLIVLNYHLYRLDSYSWQLLRLCYLCFPWQFSANNKLINMNCTL